MNSWCEAGATLCATPGGWSGRSGERGARRRGLRGERKAVVEAEDWEGPAFKTCANAAVVCKAIRNFPTSGSFVLQPLAEIAALAPQDQTAGLPLVRETYQDGREAARARISARPMPQLPIGVSEWIRTMASAFERYASPLCENAVPAAV